MSIPTAGESATQACPQPRPDRLREHELAENFPVALRILPTRLRHDLRAVYAVVRTIDELGDSAGGDRTAALQDFGRELSQVWDGGTPSTPVLRRLVPTVRARHLTQEPFRALVQANLTDQQVTSYETFDDLMGYCMLSAAPIGQIVLQLLAAATPRRLRLSDQVCSGLQIVEHCQDVAEDRRAGRIYLPRADMNRFGVHPSDLDARVASPALRRLIQHETDRAQDLLDSAGPLLRELRGAGRVAVAGFVAGGRAAVDAVRRADGEVLRETPHGRRRDLARHLGLELRSRR